MQRERETTSVVQSHKERLKLSVEQGHTHTQKPPAIQLLSYTQGNSTGTEPGGI